MEPTIFLSEGMGVESATILHLWLTEPASRDFPLSRLVVGTAMTGNEHDSTAEAFTRHLLPLMRENGVRYVQVARRGPSKEDGVVVLDDSASPERLHIEGAYTLADEMLRAGTLPQLAKRKRLCSANFKGWVLDSWIAENVRGPFRHVMGYNADELERVEKDMTFRSELRDSEYPLVTMGWTRALCEDYLLQATGIRWPKSCCKFCPFTRGTDPALERMLAEPGAAEESLLMEHMALALNPRMKLYASGTLRSKLEARAPEVVRAFLAQSALYPWAVYRVRRVYKALGLADRQVTTVFHGSRALAERQLRRLVPSARVSDGHMRAMLRERTPGVYPSVEDFLVACPAIPDNKEGPGFASSWYTATGERLEAPHAPQLSLFAA